MKRELTDRLGGLRVEIDGRTAERHIGAVRSELRNPGKPSTDRRRPRTRLATVVAAAVLLALPGVAFAAEGTVPGDLLYPIKRAAETVISVIDPNITAEHRIEELEIVIDRGADDTEIADRLADAESAVDARDVPVELATRLDRARAQTRAGSDSRSEPPITDEPAPTTTTDAGDPPGSTQAPDTTRPRTDEPPPTTQPPARGDEAPGHDSTTTTHPPGERDGPPGDGPPGDGRRDG